eukprot:GILJ01007920.1.p1 GENE.GILJ01007920.1~~GILJ01007920.1.p1  ORF type:complete len:165 (+),score=26.75 GILJ01007920.1:2-496(+)
MDMGDVGKQVVMAERVKAKLMPNDPRKIVERPQLLRLAVNLSGSNIVYNREAHGWQLDSIDSSKSDAELKRLREENALLRQKTAVLVEEKNKLIFKNEILIDLLAVTQLDLERVRKMRSDAGLDEPAKTAFAAPENRPSNTTDVQSLTVKPLTSSSFADDDFDD